MMSPPPQAPTTPKSLHRRQDGWKRVEKAFSPTLPGHNFTHAPLRLIWRLVWLPTAGRMSKTLRMTVASLTGIMVGEIWHIPMMVVVPILILALWSEDRVSNILAGSVVLVFFSFVMLLLYGAVLLSINNYFLVLFVNLVFSFLFFYLSSATKLGTISVMGGLILSFFLLILDQIPVGDLVTRFILYGWLSIAISALTMIGMGLLIAPSPVRVLTTHLAARLQLAARLLRCAPNSEEATNLRDEAYALLLGGATPLLKNVALAKMEKMWAPQLLNRLRQASLQCFGLLTVTTTVTGRGLEASQEEIESCASRIEEVARLLQSNQLPDAQPSLKLTSPQLLEIQKYLENFSAPSSEELPKPPAGGGLFLPDAFTTPDHVRFAIKGTLAVLVSMLIFKGLNWNGIHTCIITCFVVALPTMGEVIAKQRLRITGALIGCALATLATAWLIPHFINVAQLILMLGLGIMAGGWIKSGDERIAYAGMQIVLATYLSDLTAFKPPTDLTVPRDRIIGILIGLAVSYVAFTRFWPLSAGTKLPALYTTLEEQLRQLAQAHTPLLKTALAAKVAETIGKTERMLEYNALEPSPYCPTQSALVSKRQALVRAMDLMEDLLLAPIPTVPEPHSRTDPRFNLFADSLPR